MKIQKNRYFCGPASLHNALKHGLSRNISQSRLAELAGTTRYGTGHRGICRAIKAVGFEAHQWQSENLESSMAWLRSSLSIGHPVILCVEQWEHWVAVIGYLGDRIHVLDPDDRKELRAENNILTWTRQTLRRHWRAGKRVTEGDPPYYAIAIGRKKPK